MAKTASRRTRSVPTKLLVQSHGALQLFEEQDKARLEKILGAKTRAAPKVIAEDLNFIAESYLVRYAHDHAPTPDSKAAEWCRSISRNSEKLLRLLGLRYERYPHLKMDLNAQVTLTNAGVGEDLSPGQYALMCLGMDAWGVLDRVPAALWFLQRTAEHAAGEYDKRSKDRKRQANIEQTQNRFLLEAIARFLQRRFKLPVSDPYPGPESKLAKSVDFVRLRLVQGAETIDFTNHGTDRAAVTRLKSFTPKAAVSLWSRLYKKRKGKVLADLELPRFNKTISANR